MAKASINFKGVKEGSELHNERVMDLSYNFKSLEEDNESWKRESIGVAQRDMSKYCKEVTGRKLQKNSKVVREAVVNLNSDHTMQDLKRLGDRLREEYKIDCFQIHIHKDEGHDQTDYVSLGLNEKQIKEYPDEKKDIKINYHAHMLFKWQDRSGNKETNKNIGKTLKLGRIDMSKIQDIVSEELGMERGKKLTKEEIEQGKGRRLEALEFKERKVKENIAALETELNGLEQKKNRDEQATDRNRHEEKRIRNRCKDVSRRIDELDIRLQEQRRRIVEIKRGNEKLREEYKRIDEYDPTIERTQKRANEIINILNENGEISEKHLWGFREEEISYAIEHLDKAVSRKRKELEESKREYKEDERRLKSSLGIKE